MSKNAGSGREWSLAGLVSWFWGRGYWRSTVYQGGRCSSIPVHYLYTLPTLPTPFDVPDLHVPMYST